LPFLQESGGESVVPSDEIYYDPYDYQIDLNPHPIWKRMRDEAPVYYNDKYNFYAYSRYSDVLEATLDTAAYSSAHGSVLDLLDLPEDLVPKMMLFTDPPVHTRLRKLVSKGFTRRSIGQLEDRTREIARKYLDAVEGRESFDVVEDFGAKIPMMVIGSLLGIPEDRQDYFRRAFDSGSHINEGEQLNVEQLFEKTANELLEVALAKRSDPQDDLMTLLVQSEIENDDGTTRPLTDLEIRDMVNLIALAGNETVARLIGWAGLLLGEHADERRKLTDDPSRIPNAIEELLRYEPPSPVQARLLGQDRTVQGIDVPAGSKVLLLTGSVGRDEREYEDPDTFNVTRSFSRHMSLGTGAHHCLGASLARLEGRVALEELLKRYPDWTVDRDTAEPVHTSTVRGYASLPISVGSPSNTG
jgi:cytochrome P450